jgi:hypothetical protein
MYSFEMLFQSRQLIYKAVADLPAEQMLAIPAGFDNNIAWNLGHLIVVQQSLHYRLSGLPMYVSMDLVNMYKGGTSPADWQTTPNIPELLELLTTLPHKLAEDVTAGKFQQFHPYTTSTGVNMQNMNDALTFNQFHEGLHLGFILALKNVVVPRN